MMDYPTPDDIISVHACEPRDLREPEWRPPSSEETRAAEEEFEKMLGGPAQRYKATLEKVDELGIGDDIDRLLSP